MIGDVIERSLRERSPLIPVEALLGNCDGGRMPEILADRLTPVIVQRLVEVCPTAALSMEEMISRMGSSSSTTKMTVSVMPILPLLAQQAR